MSNTHRRVRSGFSIMDLVILLAVAAVALALITPALQSSRQQTRQADCAHNLKMLVLAMHNYHDVYKSFPAMRLGTLKGEGEAASVQSNRYCMSGWVSLSPFLEQQRVYDRARQRNFGPVPWRNEPDTWAVQIPTLLCADDQPNAKTATGNSSYKFCLGTSVEENHSVWGPPHNGAFTVMGDPAARRRPYGLRDIRDGTSNTVAMSERRIAGHQDPQDIANVAIEVPGLAQAALDQAYKACWQVTDEGQTYKAGQKVMPGHGPGERWADGRPYFAGFTTVLAPNGPSCMSGSAHGGPGIFTASSRHPNQVNAAMCDGRAIAVSNTIDLKVWQALGTRAGAEPIDADLRPAPSISAFWQRFLPKKETTYLNNPADMTPEDEAAELKQLATEQPPKR